MKRLIITEKPSVAQEFAKVLGVNCKKDGMIENDTWVITWCVGHLIQLSYPEKYNEEYKKWELDKLPFLPEKYIYEVIPDVAKQYKIVHRCLHREDIECVFWAGDAGREGQLIEELIRMYGGVRKGMTERRIWIDSQTEDAILEGIKDAKYMSDYQKMSNAGIMRSIEDYSMGINFSRALSLRYGGFSAQAFGNPRKKVIAVGRVMSCVLAMIVNREREISCFTPQIFYRIQGIFQKGNNSYILEWKLNPKSRFFEKTGVYDDYGLLKKETAEEFINDLKKNNYGTVSKMIHKDTKKAAPLLFNLAELQAECTKLLHISPSKTLDIAQSLYEKKMITYPRTDSRVLSSSIAAIIKNHLIGIGKLPMYIKYTNCIIEKGWFTNISDTKYTDDSKVSDHYAIIPTGKTDGFHMLSDIEKMVYDLVCRRFLSIFYPAAIYDTIKFEVEVENELLSLSQKIMKKRGYLIINNDDGNNECEQIDNSLLDIKEGDKLLLNELLVKEGKTVSPRRYTSGSMILAMENAGKLIEEDELREQIKGSGIGTSSTRAEIIEKLTRNQYIVQNDKTQVLTPTNGGEAIYEIISATIPELLVPETTAEWEEELYDIENGNRSMEDCLSKLNDFVRKKTIEIIENDKNLYLEEHTRKFRRGNKYVIQRHPLGVKCPKCGGDIIASEYGVKCEHNNKDKQECDFFIGKICGVLLNDEQARELIVKKKTGPIDGMKGKTGTFSAYILLKKLEDGSIKLEFEFPKLEVLENVKCPKCGGRIFDNHGKGFICENNTTASSEKKCDFYIWKYGKKIIPKGQVEKLLLTGKTDLINGFKSSKNLEMIFSAYLVWNSEEEKIKYEMADRKQISDMKCPLCNGVIEYIPGRGYICENNSHTKESEKCRFYIGKIAGKEITEKELRMILSGEKTDIITGFKSSEGKIFAAALRWDSNNKKVVFDFTNAKYIENIKCPKCGGKIKVVPGYGYSCENNDNSPESKCNFFIGKIAKKMLSENDIQRLLLYGKTNEIKGFTSKTGKKFAAAIRLKKDNSGIEFDFSQNVESTSVPQVIETEFQCPICKGKLIRTNYYIECGCGYRIPSIISRYELSDNEIKLLLNGEEIFLSGLVSKNGKRYEAFLQMDQESGQLKPFRFPDKDK